MMNIKKKVCFMGISKEETVIPTCISSCEMSRCLCKGTQFKELARAPKSISSAEVAWNAKRKSKWKLTLADCSLSTERCHHRNILTKKLQNLRSFCSHASLFIIDFLWIHFCKDCQCGSELPNFATNPLHPNISKHILHTVLYTIPTVWTRRICLSIKSFFSWWSCPLFS